MKSRMLSALAIASLAIAVSTACTPGTSPSPSPTPAFSTEAEAFAAAEETYRAYVDALNQIDVSDPQTFEPVFSLTEGEANAAIRKSLSEYHARKLTVAGQSRVDAFGLVSSNFAPAASVVAVACVDVSQVTLTDPEGNSVVDDARPEIQTVQVESVSDPSSPTGMLIRRLTGSPEPSPC